MSKMTAREKRLQEFAEKSKTFVDRVEECIRPFMRTLTMDQIDTFFGKLVALVELEVRRRLADGGKR